MLISPVALKLIFQYFPPLQSLRNIKSFTALTLQVPTPQLIGNGAQYFLCCHLPIGDGKTILNYMVANIPLTKSALNFLVTVILIGYCRYQIF